MKLECNDILNHIQANVFYAVFNAKTGELKDFYFIKFTSFSKWEKKHFDSEFVKNNVLKEDLPVFYGAALKVKEEKNTEVVYRFKKKDGGFVFIKSKLSLISYDENEIYCIGTNENVTDEKEYEVIVEKIRQSPHIGYIIFRENVLYANECAKEILELPDKPVPLYEFIKSISKEDLKDILQRRLKGENIFIYRKEIELDTKKRKFIDVYAQTIIYKGRYAGLAIITDQTDSVKRNRLLKMLNDISDYTFTYTQKRQYFEAVASVIEKYGYSVYIKYQNISIGKPLDLEENKFNIINNENKEYKSMLVLPVTGEGVMVLKCGYINEFEEKFSQDYKEIQKAVNFAVTTIKHNMLMQVLKEAIERSYQWVLMTDATGKIIYVNDVVTEITGYKKEEVLGNTPFMFNNSKNANDLYYKMVTALSKKEIFEDLFVGEGRKGEFYLKIKIIPVEVDEVLYYVALGIDMTKEKKLHDSLFIDEMTGFLNRKGFLLKAKNMLADNSNHVLLLIDIRNFKALNQIRGNVYGNLILKEFSHFLKTFFYEEDLIARIGGDEFAVLIRIGDTSSVVSIVQKFISKVEHIENMSINIGISLYRKDAADVHSLLEKAYIALEFAKKEGENTYEFYNENIKEEVETFLKAKSMVNKALKNNKFEYFFQPYYDIKHDRIVGFEALIRIIDDDFKVITPFYFIDYAEKSGVIKNIEKLMFKKIPEYLDMLKMPVSFNVSAVSFRDKEHIEELCKWDSKLELTIELTERTVAKNLNYAKSLFETIKNKNFKIAIDDFGTGYSSLSYIKDLNFDVLKIDISFIKHIADSYKDLAVVKTIITLAKALNLKTIAEGVETFEQLEILKDLGCDIAQGYLIAKPMPVEKALNFIKNFKGLKK